MNLRGIIDRLDDWMNPIVVKELRQAVQSRLVVAILLMALGLQVFILGTFLIVGEARQVGQPVSWRVGAEIFQILQGILLFCCLLLIPAYTGVRLAAERSAANTDLLFVTSLRPRSIVLGKFTASLVLAVLVFSAFAPFMTLTYLLRGIDIPSILLLLAVDLLAVIFGTQLALFLAAVPAPLALRVLLHLLELFVLGMIFIGVLGWTAAFLRGIGIGEDPQEFYAAFATVALLVLATAGLFFCWSVALISPPPSNRAPAGRLFLVGMWLALGAAAALLSRRVKADPPVLMWTMLSVVLGCLQFFVSINERERWAVRVARQIPRNEFLRIPAFLFFSGAAGGVTLSVLMVVLTLAAASQWPLLSRARFRLADAHEHLCWVMGLAALYVYCYGMTAVLLRRYLLGDRVRANFTWLIAFVLVGLGSSLPSVVAYIGFSEQVRHMLDNPWWLLSNPFAAVYDVSISNLSGTWTKFVASCFTFTALWALAVTLLSLPWYINQVVNFRPPPRSAPRPVPVLEALPADASPVKAG
jgi:hypothetical protein